MTVPVCTARPPVGPRPDRWAGLRPVPRGARVAVGRPVAMALFRNAVARLPVRVELPGGHSIGGGRDDASAPLMVVRDPAAFAARIAATGLIGFGEAYMTGEWSAPDPAGVLTVFACAIDRLVPPPLQSLRSWLLPRQPREHRATAAGARNNAAHHYDLSNEFFASFLDDTMTYSSALFEQLEPRPVWGELAAAQRRKIDLLLDDAGVGPGTTVLEIGTGWGELAIRAARRGAFVRSVTLSSQQLALARGGWRRPGSRIGPRSNCSTTARCAADTTRWCRWRWWRRSGSTTCPTISTPLTRVLAQGGRVALQVITMPHARMLAGRHTHTWIQKYIFPGGFLPSEVLLAQQFSQHSGLRTVQRRALGQHYAQTLRLWRERFDAASPRVDELGFDDVFRRMWQLYLAYSEAGFRSGYLDVVQLVLEHRQAGTASSIGATR